MFSSHRNAKKREYARWENQKKITFTSFEAWPTDQTIFAHMSEESLVKVSYDMKDKVNYRIASVLKNIWYRKRSFDEKVFKSEAFL